jgi:hypothetical protein
VTQWMILREVAQGDGRLLGITTDTNKTPEEITDFWVERRGDFDGTVRLHFCDVSAVVTVDAEPVVQRSAATTVIPPDQAFPDPTLINVP